MYGQPYGYKGCKITQVNHLFFQGGDELTTSIYNGPFDDENFIHNHDPYRISMFHDNPNANVSQFRITGKKIPDFDGKYVVFGEVIEGFNIVDDILSIKRYRDKPVEDITIVDCGEF